MVSLKLSKVTEKDVFCLVMSATRQKTSFSDPFYFACSESMLLSIVLSMRKECSMYVYSTAV